jgi:nitric oxide reductase subunit C
MTTKTAKWIFFAGTISSAALFLILTADTHRQIGALTHADKLSAEVIAGKKVFQKHNCNDCHTILGFGGYYSPDLTRVYGRRGENYVRRVLKEPNVVFAKSFRKMPQQNLSPEEIDRLVAFLQWVNEIDTHDWPPQDSKSRRTVNRLVTAAGMSPGAAIFKQNNCFDCHKLQGTGGDAGPALDEIGLRHTPESIARYVRNPKEYKPNTEMPDYPDLSDQDLRDLGEFLAAQKGGRP